MRHFEFWHPRLFELPYYLYLMGAATVRGLSIRDLARANYALDHGEIGIGSKFATQMAFDQSRFLPTIHVPGDLAEGDKVSLIRAFAAEHGYPVILKSDIGSVGKGVLKVSSADEVGDRIHQLTGPYIAQSFTPFNHEYGVFYVRVGGRPRITGINAKHFPSVVGDGKSTIAALARQHYRFTHHWQTFLQYLDVDRVPATGEVVQLSFIGSHTMGCKFTDDTHLATRALEHAIFDLFESQPGYNFGRIDVKAESEEAFRSGEFVVIEVNGVASLPTHMFDPDNSVWRAWRIFLEHGRYLALAAGEHRHEPMALDSYRGIVRRVRANAATLNEAHQRLMEAGG